MIFLTMPLSFGMACRGIFKSALSLWLNVARLFEIRISCGRSFQSRISVGKNDFNIIEYLNVRSYAFGC